MKKTLPCLFIEPIIIFALLLTFSSLNAQSQNFEWAKKIGGNLGQFGTNISIDSLGNIFTVGMFDQITDFNPGEEIFNLTPIGSEDIFITKLGSDGNFLWAKQFGGDVLYNRAFIDSDENGNLYITGGFYGIVDFDPGINTYNLSSTAGSVFISKLDNNGNFEWAKAIGGSFILSRTISVSSEGDVFTTGCFGDTIDFDPNEGIYNLICTEFEQVDAFVLKLNTEGEFVWVKKMGSEFDEEPFSICIDSLSNVYTIGVFYGLSDFDPGEGVHNLIPDEYLSNYFISKLDNNGDFVWAKKIAGSSLNIDNIQIDSYGNVYTAGNFFETGDLDPSEDTTYLVTSDYNNIFVLKLNVNGDFNWIKLIETTSISNVSSFVLDMFDNIYVTGQFKDTVDFDPEENTYNLISNGDYDIYVLKLNPQGDFMWAESFGSLNSDEGRSIEVNSIGNIHINGTFQEVVDFNPTEEVFNLTATEYENIFVLKLNQSEITSIKENLNTSLSIIYPNPSKGLFTIQLKEESEITITNTLGKTLLSQTMESGIQYLNIQNQANGLYFVRVVSKGGIGMVKIEKEE